MNAAQVPRSREPSSSGSEGSAGADRSSFANNRRRSSKGGSRSVSNLSKEQLEKKRQNDREAQRAIRQRTKDHIERLEREVQQLRNTRGSNDLTAALRENEMLKSEIHHLRSQLQRAQPASPSSLSDSTRPSGTVHSVWDGHDIRRHSLVSAPHYPGPTLQPMPLATSPTGAPPSQPLRFPPPHQTWQAPDPFAPSFKAEPSPPSSVRTGSQDFTAWGAMDRARHAGTAETQAYAHQPPAAYTQLIGSQQNTQSVAYSQLPPMQPGLTAPPLQPLHSLQPLQHALGYQQHGMPQYGPISGPSSQQYFQQQPQQQSQQQQHSTQEGEDRPQEPSPQQGQPQDQVYYHSYQQPPPS